MGMSLEVILHSVLVHPHFSVTHHMMPGVKFSACDAMSVVRKIGS